MNFLQKNVINGFLIRNPGKFSMNYITSHVQTSKKWRFSCILKILSNRYNLTKTYKLMFQIPNFALLLRF